MIHYMISMATSDIADVTVISLIFSGRFILFSHSFTIRCPLSSRRHDITSSGFPYTSLWRHCDVIGLIANKWDISVGVIVNDMYDHIDGGRSDTLSYPTLIYYNDAKFHWTCCIWAAIVCSCFDMCIKCEHFYDVSIALLVHVCSTLELGNMKTCFKTFTQLSVNIITRVVYDNNVHSYFFSAFLPKKQYFMNTYEPTTRHFANGALDTPLFSKHFTLFS